MGNGKIVAAGAKKASGGSNNLVLLVRNSRAKVHLDLASPQRTSTSLSKHCHIISIAVCRLSPSRYNLSVTIVGSRSFTAVKLAPMISTQNTEVDDK